MPSRMETLAQAQGAVFKYRCQQDWHSMIGNRAKMLAAKAKADFAQERVEELAKPIIKNTTKAIRGAEKGRFDTTDKIIAMQSAKNAAKRTLKKARAVATNFLKTGNI